MNINYPELQEAFISETSVKVMICSAISQADNYHRWKSMSLSGVISGSYKEEADYGREELKIALYGRLADLLYMDRKLLYSLENGLAALSALYV